jgi:Zn-dependent alcohol dehydrogenase
VNGLEKKRGFKGLLYSFKIDDDFPSDVTCLIGCSVSTGIGGVINQPDMFPGASIVVFEAGGVGLTTLLGAQIMNATKTMTVDINDSKLEFRYKFAATHTINSKSKNAVKKIMPITNGLGAGFVFDTFGSTQIVTQMMAALKKGGSGVIISGPPVEAMADIGPQDMVKNHKK